MLKRLCLFLPVLHAVFCFLRPTSMQPFLGCKKLHESTNDPVVGEGVRSLADVSRLASSPKRKDDAQELKEKADSLRKEIDELERQKLVTVEDEQRRIDQIKAEEQTLRVRYGALVPILKPDGTTQQERCDFQPKHKDGSSYITVCEASLPLGIVLGESEDWALATVVDEVATDSNGETAGLKVGDVVHACTACKVEMEMPTWQVSYHFFIWFELFVCSFINGFTACCSYSQEGLVYPRPRDSCTKLMAVLLMR